MKKREWLPAFMREARVQAPPEFGSDYVVWAYRLLLDREPEDERRVAAKVATWSSAGELRREFMTSDEFRAKNPDLALTNEPAVVIREIAPGLRLFIDLSDHIVGRGILRGIYEVEELERVRQLVRPGDVVLDIGANVGFFTMHMAALVGEQGKVYSFEPHPELGDLFSRSVAENGFDGRVELFRAAVADTPGRANLFTAPASVNRSGSFLLGGNDQPNDPGVIIDVPRIKIDDLPLRRPVAFIKIDVEGAEPMALAGAERLLAEDRPLILAELNPTQLARVSNTTAEGLIAAMAARGYECRDLGGQTVTGANAIASVLFHPT